MGPITRLDFSWHLKSIPQPNRDSLPLGKSAQSLPFPTLFSLPRTASSLPSKNQLTFQIHLKCYSTMKTLSLFISALISRPRSFSHTTQLWLFLLFTLQRTLFLPLWWYLIHATSHFRFLYTCLTFSYRL